MAVGIVEKHARRRGRIPLQKVLELAGFHQPGNDRRRHLRKTEPLDGREAWATITEGKPSPHADILLNTTPGGGAIRAGDWKLVLNGGGADNPDGEPAPKNP